MSCPSPWPYLGSVSVALGPAESFEVFITRFIDSGLEQRINCHVPFVWEVKGRRLKTAGRFASSAVFLCRRLRLTNALALVFKSAPGYVVTIGSAIR